MNGEEIPNLPGASNLSLGLWLDDRSINSPTFFSLPEHHRADKRKKKGRVMMMVIELIILDS